MALRLASSSRSAMSQVISSWRLSLYWKKAPSSCSTSKLLISSVNDLNLSNQNCFIPMRLFCCRPTLLLHIAQETNLHDRRCFSTSPSSDNQVPSQSQTSSNTFDDVEPDMYQQSSSIRRRPYNLEAKMRMKQYRREAMQRQRAQEIEDEERNFQLDTSKLYKKGDPGTVQGVVKDIITVGYFMKLPNGREGFLPCSQFGCSGGIPLLTRIFKVGDEITVRAEIVGDGGKDRLYCKDTDKWA